MGLVGNYSIPEILGKKFVFALLSGRMPPLNWRETLALIVERKKPLDQLTKMEGQDLYGVKVCLYHGLLCLCPIQNLAVLH